MDEVTYLGIMQAQEFGVDLGEGFAVTVVVTNQTAYCTCRDFWQGDKWRSRAGGYRAAYPQLYFGATVGHGCRHVDFVVERYGYTPQPEDVAPPKRREPVDVVDLMADSFSSGMALGRKLGRKERG